jgi:ribose transport system permease protein
MSTKTTPATNEKTRQRGCIGAVRRQAEQSLAFASLLIISVFFALENSAFYSWDNITGILLSVTVTGMLAIGTTFVIITGGIDLSIGTGTTLTAVVTAYFLTKFHFPMPVGILVGSTAGAILGAINGMLITILNLPPFIATLAMMLVAKGLALVISGVAPIYTDQVAGWNSIALGNLIPNLPNAVLILLVSAFVASIILNRTIIGRYTFAIGSNAEATRLSGVNVVRWTILIYTIGGIFVGMAGILLSSRLNSAQPALGSGYELEAIAAVIIGGTSLLGGKGSILGTIIGALIMGVLINGLRIMQIQQEWQTVVVGTVIVIAVYTDSLRRKRARI